LNISSALQLLDVSTATANMWFLNNLRYSMALFYVCRSWCRYAYSYNFYPLIWELYYTFLCFFLWRSYL